jgi:AcrR family transcriptional regulator
MIEHGITSVKGFHELVHYFSGARMTETLTPKGERTRERILDAALELFAAEGYHGATMREIAARAHCSLGLAYRYFSRKEELVLAFYDRTVRELEEQAAALRPGKLANRIEQAMRADLARIAPYRGAFGALFGVALSPDSEVAVLGERMAGVRDRVWRVFYQVVKDSSDAPREKQARDLATLFYACHLGLVLLWLQDRSPNQRSTEDMLKFGRNMVARLRPVLGMPMVARPLARLARVLTPMFGPAQG